jgi:PAS domain S-box-containing protein
MANAKILVVEDEVILAKNIETKLEALGYSVLDTVSSGKKAIQLAGKLNPDLVLMDIRLKGDVDGVETAEQIRTRYEIPVIYLTAYADDQTLKRAKITEPFGYILKPFEVAELHSNIEMALYKREMEKKLKESEARYRAVSELSSDFAFTFNIKPDNRLIHEWTTEAYSRITGYSPEEIDKLGGLENIIYPDDFSIFSKYLETIISNQMCKGEFRIVTKNGKIRWLQCYCRSIWNDVENRAVKIYGAAKDITDRKYAEDALRESDDFNFALFQYNPIETIVVDPEGKIIRFNLAQEKSGNRLPNINDVMFKEYANNYEIDMYTELIKCIKTSKVKAFPEIKSEKKVYCITISPFSKGAIITSQDITERKKAEEELLNYQKQLRSMASELSLVEERERRRIASELHDRIGQSLFILRLKLSTLQDNHSSTDFSESIKEIHKLLDQIIQHTRNLTFELSPPILYELGLEAALEWLTEQMQEQWSIQIDFKGTTENFQLDNDVSMILFKAVRELLSNVIKHAKAKRVKTLVKDVNNSVKIDIIDDGIGFHIDKKDLNISKMAGFGLFNIMERIDYLGGKFEIKSKPGHGTHVTLIVPKNEIRKKE